MLTNADVCATNDRTEQEEIHQKWIVVEGLLLAVSHVVKTETESDGEWLRMVDEGPRGSEASHAT